MIILNFFLLAASLFLVIKSADKAITYSTELAKGLKLPKYIIGFIIVAIISILPETFISITSALEGIPAFGLGTIFGSNVADLTLILAIVVLTSGRQLKVESSIIKNSLLYIGILSLPLLLGFDGLYSRAEGVTLIIAGTLFYISLIKKRTIKDISEKKDFSPKSLTLLLLSMGTLLIGAHFSVKFGVSLAKALEVNPVLIGMFVVGLGTTLPELFFSLRAAKKNDDSLALGDILGTVIADATIVIGIVALISPFAFNPRIVYVTGAFMLGAIILLLHFMKTGKKLSRKEALLLLLFYLGFAISELLISKIM